MIPVGTLVMNQQFAPGSETTTTQTPSMVEPLTPVDFTSVFADFSTRLANVEIYLSANTVGKDNILSQIAISPEAILIESSKIAVVGQATFADYIRTLNGTSTGVLDPSITQIVGGVIRTGQIFSQDGYSWINLSALGTTPFINIGNGGTPTAVIEANGNFTFGPSTGSQLTWNGTSLAVGANVLLDGVYTSTVVAGASLGATALQTAMQVGVANVLTGSGAVEYGNLVYNTTTGAYVSGAGTVISSNGIASMTSASSGFAITSAGNAVFSGTVSASAILSSSYINVTGYVYASGGTTTGSVFAAITGVATTEVGVYGQSTSGTAVEGYATGSGGVGVLGVSSGAGGYAVVAEAFSGGVALQLTGPMETNDHTLVSNLNSNYVNGIYFGPTNIGTATATFTSTNKPGSNSANTWSPVVNTSGTTIGYIPVWT